MLLLWEDPVDPSSIRRMHDLHGPQPSLTLTALLGENVAVIRTPMLELARSRLLEALGGATVYFSFCHDKSPKP